MLCRESINSLDAFKNLPYAYDGCGILDTPKALKENIEVKIAQPDLNENLKKHLVDVNGILNIIITQTATHMLSDITRDDRSIRTCIEIILNEFPVTREEFVASGPGCLVETREYPSSYGLVTRDGNSKGVQIITGKNGAPQLAVSIDCSKKLFFPQKLNFGEFLNQFLINGKTYDDAEKLCFGLCLADNQGRINYFQNFVLLDDVQHAAMRKSSDIFALKDLEIIPGQQVSINALPKDVKESALKLNRFKPDERKKLIIQQIRKMKLNNKITAAFGITVKEEFLEGEYVYIAPPNIILGNNQTIFPDENNSFEIDCRNYIKKGKFDKLVLLATREDKELVWNSFIKIAKFATNNHGRRLHDMIIYESFDTWSRDASYWINAVGKFKESLVVCIDTNPESHDLLKWAGYKTGVVTQHIRLDTAKNVGSKTSQNICHKVNVKTSGFNNAIKFVS
uniref:Uncharacterized protein n=1 Tax=Panagrolaimus sp. ES5 TaxID=591445 RepID=A0AC34FG55_9BILA